jgi:hypothetical protein
VRSNTRRNDARRRTACRAKDIIKIQTARENIAANKPVP